MILYFDNCLIYGLRLFIGGFVIGRIRWNCLVRWYLCFDLIKKLIWLWYKVCKFIICILVYV